MDPLAKVKFQLSEYLKSLPEHGKAEDTDFEVWGREFCRRMVSIRAAIVIGEADN